MSKHPTLIVMTISKSFSSFFNFFFLPFSLAIALRKHMIFNQIFNQKQVKDEKMGRSKQPKEHPWPQILFLNHSLTT
jgi:hypothetical protein